GPIQKWKEEIIPELLLVDKVQALVHLQLVLAAVEGEMGNSIDHFPSLSICGRGHKKRLGLRGPFESCLDHIGRIGLKKVQALKVLPEPIGQGRGLGVPEAFVQFLLESYNIGQ